MKNLSVMIKPASSLCNLKCKYCFYADVSSNRAISSYGMMTSDTAQFLIDNVFASLNDGDHITFSFQGGEPTLAGLSFFENFVKSVKMQKIKATVHYSIQTNGIEINSAWCAFLRENNFLVGLSLDCIAEIHNQNRVDNTNNGTFLKVMATKSLFDKEKIEYNILTVLTNSLARHSLDVWNFLINNNIRFVQFIPCLDELQGETKSPYALTPQKFAMFYNNLFKLWERELLNNRYVSVKLFDDIINLLARKSVNACGLTGQCGAQFVIEADGSVYPCDFYVLDKYNLGSICKSSPKQLYETNVMYDFLSSKDVSLYICNNCKFTHLCGGGCKRMKNAIYANEDNTYCGYQDFLDTNFDALNRIAKNI